MPHETGLIVTIAGGFALALVLGLLAVRLRLPALVGYLVAGIVVGPFTPGFTADVDLAAQLAEIGVILLMFGVGLHFSVSDLLSVKRIAVPGAVAQIAVATVLGMVVSHFWGWPWGTGFVFGLSLSVASTVVLLRALDERGLIDSPDGRIAVGWLVVEDLAMVLALVLLPALAVPLGGTMTTSPTADAAGGVGMSIFITLMKVAAFVALMHYVGRRAVPWLLERVARLGSRELFTLSVLAIALGIAVGAAALFGVSFALGAFFAGVVISESDLSHQAGADALPLQDAFAVLFFVSVGMLFDPRIVMEQPLHLVAAVLIIMVGKSLAALGIVLAFRYPLRTALTISASLAQIGEFSFILAGLGIVLGILPEEGRSLILAGALISITLNPLVFATIEPLNRWIHDRPRLLAALERPEQLSVTAPRVDTGSLGPHVVLVGYGRVGRRIGEALEQHRIPFIVVERDRLTVERLLARGVPALFGDAARPQIIEHLHLETARLLLIASPDPHHARRVIELAREINPDIHVAVRTHTESAQDYVQEKLGVGRAFMGERELALSMARYALVQLGRTDDQADETIESMRRATELKMRPISF